MNSGSACGTRPVLIDPASSTLVPRHRVPLHATRIQAAPLLPSALAVANTSAGREALRGVGLRFPWKPQNALAAPTTPLPLHGPAYRARPKSRAGRPVARTSTLPRRPLPALPRTLSGWPRASAAIRAGSRRRGRLCRQAWPMQFRQCPTACASDSVAAGSTCVRCSGSAARICGWLIISRCTPRPSRVS